MSETVAVLSPGLSQPALVIPPVHEQPLVQFVDGDTATNEFPNGLTVDIILSGELRIFEQGRLLRAGRQQVLLSAGPQLRETTGDFSAIRLVVDHSYISYCFLTLVRRPEPAEELNAVIIPEPTPIRKDAENLLKQLDSPRPNAAIINRHLARQLILKIMLTEAAAIPAAIFPAPSVIQQPGIGYFLEANFTKKLTVPQLAAAAGKSLSSFKRDFKQTYGQAPLQWLINRRLEYAFFLIRYTGYSISTIAQLCGFAGQAYFSAAYKEKFGISPLQSKLKGIES